jgi:hypothetical protein
MFPYPRIESGAFEGMIYLPCRRATVRIIVPVIPGFEATGVVHFSSIASTAATHMLRA